MLFVSRVDALRAVAAKKIDVEFLAAELLQHRHTHFFCSTGIHRGLVDDHIALFQCLADCLAGQDQRAHVGPIGMVDRGRHRHDKNLAAVQILRAATHAQVGRGLQLSGADLQRVILPSIQLGDSRSLGVKTNHGAKFAELNRQRQADVTQANDCDFCVIQVHGSGNKTGKPRQSISLNRLTATCQSVFEATFFPSPCAFSSKTPAWSLTDNNGALPAKGHSMARAGSSQAIQRSNWGA